MLFISAARRVELIQCFRADARQLGIELRVLAAEVRPDLSPACHLADTSFALPPSTAPEYLPLLLALCRQEKVDLLVPIMDGELALLSRARAAFAALGVRVVVSAPEVVALAADKFATAERLSAAGVPAPRTLRWEDYQREPAQLRWPVIAKPNGGCASVGLVRPGRPEDLAGLRGQDYIVQELWQGREYTVNVFFDAGGRLRCAVPHWRVEVRAGEVGKGFTERVPALADAAQKLAALLPGARGPLCFQAIVTDSGNCAVFEINARFGGGYPLAHRAGARFSQWLLEELDGRPGTANDDWRAGVAMLRYDQSVFVDG